MENYGFVTALLLSFMYIYRQYSIKAFAVWVYFWGGCFCAAASTALAWYRAPVRVTLPDAAFDLLNTLIPLHIPSHGAYYHRIADVYSLVLLLGTVALLHARNQHAYLRRLFTLYGTVLYLRALLMPLTAFPDPYPACHALVPGTQAWSKIPWLRLPHEALSLFTSNDAKMNMTCGDMMFSGHTSMLVSCALTWHSVLPRSSTVYNIPKLAAHTAAGFGILLLLLFRMHYSIDVVTAALVTFVCWNYQQYLTDCTLRAEPFKHVFVLDGLLLYPAVQWLES